jgi:sugar phosphate isomerase/epimerase
MGRYCRRTFLQVSTAVCASAAVDNLLASNGEQGLRLGLVVSVPPGGDPDKAIAKVHKLGLPTCQVVVGEPSLKLATELRSALDRYGIEATTLISLGPKPLVFNLSEGPMTIGLVPREYRTQRIENLQRTSDMAKQCGVPAVHTHCGFIPENLHDPLYGEAVDAIRKIASYCQANSQHFFFETGQETPITLLRAIGDVGLPNIGVNLDTANLILYGKGDPVDALDVIGTYVRGVHAKDGLFPTDPRGLGKEVPIGQGKANFPEIIGKLRQLGYRGPVTIERETEGPQQLEDVQKSSAYLKELIAKAYGSAG